MKDLRATIPTNPGKNYPTRNLDEITHVIVHHSATKRGSAGAFARFHIGEYDWPGIAYHYVIDKDGTVNKTLDHHKVGYHCRGMNRKGIGICLVGNYDIEAVYPDQFAALKNLLLDLRRSYKWEVGFHFEYSQKSCPGHNFPHRVLLREIEQAEHVDPNEEDEKEPDTTMTGPGIDDEEPPLVSPPVTAPAPIPVTKDKSQNPGCLFSIFHP